MHIINKAIIREASQAMELLASVLPKPKYLCVKQLLGHLEKETGAKDLINSPTLQNVINILAPYIINQNVKQVLKLLKDLSKEVDRGSGPIRVRV